MTQIFLFDIHETYFLNTVFYIYLSKCFSVWTVDFLTPCWLNKHLIKLTWYVLQIHKTVLKIHKTISVKSKYEWWFAMLLFHVPLPSISKIKLYTMVTHLKKRKQIFHSPVPTLSLAISMSSNEVTIQLMNGRWCVKGSSHVNVKCRSVYLLCMRPAFDLSPA